jgi:arylsulfatase A
MSFLSSIDRYSHCRRSVRISPIWLLLLSTTLCVVLLSMWDEAASWAAEPGSCPNIVLILADDMGYGDVHALNPESTIPTANLDQLAQEGMTFTDAHSPSAVCTPTRYGLLTGRYCWRTRLKRGVLGGYSPPLISKDRPTVATMLKGAGYRTGAVGKWHLGMQLPSSKPDADLATWKGDPGIDYTGLITDSPIHHGFDYYFGVTASLDMAPYVYVRNDRFTMSPSIQQPAVNFPHFIRSGPRARDFVVEECLDRLTSEAVTFIEKAASQDAPFFLYLPLTAPHKPTQPHQRFRGKTGLNEYGDFVTQVDWTVGQVVQAIENAKIVDETVVIYTSDNGSYMHRYDEHDRKDHVDDPSVQGYRADHHRANGPFRGTKADIWEAGHHVPLFVRWPGRVQPGSMCDKTVGLTDIFATCAEIVGAELGDRFAEDSLSLLPMLNGDDVARKSPVIHHSANGMFAIRDGKWKLVLGNGSGGRENPRGKPFERPYQLYDMSTDVGEATDLSKQHPEVVDRLTQRFEQIRQAGRSR